MRIFIAELTDSDVIEIVSEDFHYLKNVMRVRVNQEVILFNEKMEILFRVNEIGKKSILLAKIEFLRDDENTARKINLYQAVIKGEKMCEALNNAVQLSVAQFIPIITQNCHIREVNLPRLEGVAKSALEQSYGMKFPRISSPVSFQSAILEIQNSILIYGDINGNRTWQDIKMDKESEINIFIGPEGGWSKDEINILSQLQNSYGVKIGNRVMRAENAVSAFMTLANLF